MARLFIPSQANPTPLICNVIVPFLSHSPHVAYAIHFSHSLCVFAVILLIPSKVHPHCCAKYISSLNFTLGGCEMPEGGGVQYVLFLLP